MACSAAQLAANRANAQKSTGPRTEAGKARSRLNAFRHGLAGGGDLAGPGEDGAEVAARAAAFAAELGASGEVGGLLAHRAALLSVRMERAAGRELAAVAASVAEARERFDEGRREAVAELVGQLDEGGSAARRAAEELESAPEGVAALIEWWEAAHAALRGGDESARRAAMEAVEERLGGEGAGPDPVRRVDAELVRLRALAGGMGDLVAAVDRARDAAGALASFDPSPEAERARRYEAAAERGMYRAIRAIVEARRALGAADRGDALSSAVVATNRAVEATKAPHPPQDFASDAARSVLIPSRVAAERTMPPDALGSFRAGAVAPAASPARPAEGPIEVAAARPRRPDLRKINRKR